MNNFFGQLRSPFAANDNLISKINTELNTSVDYISKIGIYYLDLFNFSSEIGEDQNYNIEEINENNKIIFTFVNNGQIQTFQLGKTGILELEDVHITSIKLNRNINTENMIIDFQMVTN